MFNKLNTVITTCTLMLLISITQASYTMNNQTQNDNSSWLSRLKYWLPLSNIKSFSDDSDRPTIRPNNTNSSNASQFFSKQSYDKKPRSPLNATDPLINQLFETNRSKSIELKTAKTSWYIGLSTDNQNVSITIYQRMPSKDKWKSDYEVRHDLKTLNLEKTLNRLANYYLDEEYEKKNIFEQFNKHLSSDQNIIKISQEISDTTSDNDIIRIDTYYENNV